MQCIQSHDTDTKELYMHGRLSAAEQEALEDHLLECEDCVAELTRLGALRAQLAERRAEIEAADTAPAQIRRLSWLPAAALLLLGLGLVFLLRLQPADGVADLASFEPPVYRPAQLRGVVDEADETFRAAMDLYVNGDYEGAIPFLDKAVTLDPSRVDALFFLSASELLSDEIPKALVHLGHVVETEDVQYLEEALYLRAQARLLQGDAEGASSLLRSIIELGGGWQDRARTQLDALEAWLASSD